MESALKEVCECHMSRNAASKDFSVPQSTLCDKLDGKTPEDRRMGPPSVLTKAEETILASFCIKYLKCGFPINRTLNDLCDIVQKVVQEDGPNPPLPMEGQATSGFKGLCAETLQLPSVQQKH